MIFDLLVRNARVFTADPGPALTDAVAVSGGLIGAIGPEAESQIGPDTHVIDAGGALVTPGFVDAHVHPATSGLDRLRCSFEDSHDRLSALQAIAEYAASNPDQEWILGAGWSMDWFEGGCPSAADLDSVVSDRPAFLMNADGHGAWVNSAALERARLDSESADPADGRIERLEDGRPQGTLHEGAASLVERHTPADTVEDFEAGLIRGQQELLRFGVTSWQDAAVTPEVQSAYLKVAESGRLVGDVVGALWWDRHRGLEQVEELIERRQQAAPGFRPTTVKLMLDGVAENFTASTLHPWLDSSGRPTDNRGTDFIDPEELKAIVTLLDNHGFQCHFHALGDRAVRQALDALEAAIKRNGRTGNRHHLAHLQFVHPDDIGRFAALDSGANVQPLWACNDEYQLRLTKPFVTPEMYEWQYPFRSILDSGARMAMGSDWGVSTANVMAQIDVATSRTCPENDPLHLEQALTAEEALLAFTVGSAYVNGAETEYGRIARGLRADLVILDRDPFIDGPFREAAVATTISRGQIVYQR